MAFKRVPVSVIIPLYNSAKYLAECVRSINKGTSPSEIIIIDDRSTDNSLEVACSLKKEYDNITLISLPLNRGAHYARQAGIEASSHEFIALVDSDDIIEEDALLDAWKRLASSESEQCLDICIWDLWRIESNGDRVRAPSNVSYFPVSGRDALMMTLGTYRIHILGVARKSLYIRAYNSLAIDCINADELLSRLVFRETRYLSGSPKRYYYRKNLCSTTQKINDKHLTYLRSDIWMMELCRVIPRSPVGMVARQGIDRAFQFYRMRGRFNREMYLVEMKSFLAFISRSAPHWRASLLRPKSLLKLSLLIALNKAKCL